MMHSKKHSCSLFTAVLAALLITSAAALATEDKDSPPSPESNRQGLFLGVNIGGGASTMTYKDGTRHIWEEGVEGAGGTLRVGYAVNPSFAFSLEGYGFGNDEDEDEWGLGAAFAAATWHPSGGGLFLRAGIGGGGGEFIVPESGEKKKIERRLAGLFGVGYDWDLGEDFTLGLSLDTVTLEASDELDFKDGHVGSSTLSIQFNWFL